MSSALPMLTHRLPQNLISCFFLLMPAFLNNPAQLIYLYTNQNYYVTSLTEAITLALLLSKHSKSVMWRSSIIVIYLFEVYTLTMNASRKTSGKDNITLCGCSRALGRPWITTPMYNVPSQQSPSLSPALLYVLSNYCSTYRCIACDVQFRLETRV